LLYGRLLHDPDNALHMFLNADCQLNRNLALACGLAIIPGRRTFDRLLQKTISADAKKENINNGGYPFAAAEGLVVDHSITATTALS
jgi:hypothetical protein